MEPLRELVESVRAIPYGRGEGCGTCSTKHKMLLELIGEQMPEQMPKLELEIVHRVYRVDPSDALALFGPRAAAAVPEDGLVDVHTYLKVTIDGRRTIVDATFPSDDAWDGRSDMPLACGPGEDYPAGVTDPWALKAELVATHCDPDVREPFIAALS